MKFAVKTSTCLGCKVPLKAGAQSQSFSLITCRGTLTREQTMRCATIVDRERRSSIRSSCKYRRRRRRRLLDSGRNASAAKVPCTRFVALVVENPTDVATGRALLEQRLPHFLHAQEGAKGRRRRDSGPGAMYVPIESRGQRLTRDSRWDVVISDS